MNKLRQFYNSFGFIIVFIFLSVIISAVFGEKFLSKFLLLVLTSQLLLNSDKAVALINGIKTSNNNNNINNSSTIHISSSGKIYGGIGGKF